MFRVLWISLLLVTLVAIAVDLLCVERRIALPQLGPVLLRLVVGLLARLKNCRGYIL